MGIEVCGTGGMATPTAQLTWGLILGLVRNIPIEDRNLKAGLWQTTIGPDIAGKNLGILGLGRLGTQVAAVGKAFGMEVLAWSRNMTQERAAEHGARAVSKDELFSESDILTIHIPLNDSSRGIVTAHELGLMKPTAYLINTSRGPIIEEGALMDTLVNRRIAGAGLDVFHQEPLPVDHPVRKLDNVVLTPHLGYVTSDQYEIYFRDIVDDIVAFAAGKPVRQVGLRQ
jgi:phosphoglycerate dehydrogenase-like enzyme